MAGGNKYLNELEYSSPASTYAGEAVPEMKALSGELSHQYEETRKNKDILDLTADNLDVRDVDFPVKKKAVDDLRNQFSTLVKNGDYQNANYIVRDAAKKFASDKMIQGALKSRASEKGYQQELHDRLEKGKINEEQYLYGMNLSKQASKNPLSYNPGNGLYSGMFKGHEVFDDKSKEIYDNFNERIKGWEAGSIMNIDGTRYKKTGGVQGGYINMETGKEVQYPEVQNALMTELSNRGDFKNFLSQERAIDKYKVSNGTGIINKDTLLKLMPEDEILNRVAGTSTTELNKLSKSGDPKDKERLTHLLDLKEKAKTTNLSNEDAESIFNSKHLINQMNKYTSPASDKAAYQLFEDKQWENKPYIMSLDYKYKRAEKELNEKQATTGVSNQSVMENFSPKELQNNYTELKNANDQLDFLKRRYGKLDTSKMTSEDKNSFEKAQINRDVLQKNLSSIKEDMKSKGIDLDKSVLKGAYFSGLEDTKKVESEIINPLIDNAIKATTDFNLKKQLQDFKNKAPELKGTNSGEELYNLLSTSKETKKVLSDFSNQIIEKARNTQDKDIGMFDLSPKGTEGYLRTVKSVIKSNEEKYFENKDLVRFGGQVLGIDEKDKNDVVAFEARKWNNLAKGGTDFQTTDGKSIKELIDNYNNDKDLPENQKAKLQDIQVQPIYQKINGKFRFQVRLPNGDLKQVIPENQQDAKASMERIGNEYINSSDPSTVNKGYEILGQTRNDFSRINLNDFKSGEIINVPLHNGKQENIYSLVKNGEDSSGNPIFQLKNTDGTDIKFSNGMNFNEAIKNGLGDPNGNNFKSLNDLSTKLLLTGFNGSIK